MALTTRLPSTKVEPFYGFVETTGDALRLIQAARQGVIPRITRRLNDLERRAMIRSGSIFIFSDEESGIKRWTEGLSWSASRIVGNFLVYREVTDRANARSPPEGRRVSKRRGNAAELSPAELAEQKLSKTLVGCLSDSNGRFKPNGLIKKTITIGVEGSDHHLIAYYSQEDVRLGRLLPLSSRADIMALDIPPELLESTKFRVPPVIENAPDGRPRYICDADEGDPSHPASLPFPSISQPSLSYQRPLDVQPRLAEANMAHPDYPSPITPINSVRMRYSQPQCQLSPSTSSITSPTSLENSFNWLTPLLGLAHVSRSGQLSSGDGGNQRAERSDVHPSFSFPAERSTSYNASPIANDPIGLLPTWNTDLGIGLGENFAFGSVPASSGTPAALYHDQSQLAQSTWTSPHANQCTPSSTSSMPSTPTQPRQSQRFTSLPSSHNKDMDSLYSVSPLCLSPHPGDTAVPPMEPSPLSANDVLNFPSTWFS